jgi:hypothetical protein
VTDLFALLNLLASYNQTPQKNATISFSPGSERGTITLQGLDDWGEKVTTNFSFSTFHSALQKMEKILDQPK